MEKLFRPARLVALALIFALILSAYATALYQLQVIRGSEYVTISENSVIRTNTISAARGDILDRNGVLLVSSKAVYNVTVSRRALLKTADPNANLLTLINAAMSSGTAYTDTFPVTMGGPFEYLADMSGQQRGRLDAYFEYFGLDPDITASDLIVWLKSHYGLDYTTPLSDARRIIGVRYELELRAIIGIPEYVFARDVSVDFVSAVLEQDLPFVTVSTSYEREYHTQHAAQILGFTGLMDAEDYEIYKELGYPLNAVVGRDGAEKAFEEYLHGTDGSVTVNTNTDGAVISILNQTPAASGQNVYLTIDIGLQADVEKILEDTAFQINSTRSGDDEKVSGAAAVVLDIRSGGVLAAGNYPTYDPGERLSILSVLDQDPDRPLWNRAFQGLYEPGSTFKMVTAYAGLNSLYLDRWFTITDTGRYTKYPSYQPKCWIYPGSHGSLNVVEALQVSCNYFFFKVGDTIGMDAIANAASLFGFGSKTGVEVTESAGIVASPEYKRSKLNEDWWAADTLLAAIGQSYNMFTPIQLANYVATIASGGSRLKTTLLSQVRSSDYSACTYTNTPVVAGAVDNSKNYIDILREGMRAVTSQGGTAYSVFKDFPIPVAAKTGTVQSDTAQVNNGVFVCYAPADDPEIAVAIVVEHGGAGAELAAPALEILKSYFSDSTSNFAMAYENTLIS